MISWDAKALEKEVANPKRTIRTLVWNGDDCVDVYASLFRKDHKPYAFMDMPRDQRALMGADKVLIGKGGRRRDHAWLQLLFPRNDLALRD